MERGELRGIRKGKIEGKIEEKQQVLVRLLKRKFGLSVEETEQSAPIDNHQYYFNYNNK